MYNDTWTEMGLTPFDILQYVLGTKIDFKDFIKNSNNLKVGNSPEIWAPKIKTAKNEISGF